MEGVIQVYDHPFSPTDHETIDRLDVPVMGEVRSGQVVQAYPSHARSTP